MIKENGLNISKDIEFPDHYKYTDGDIEQIIDQANALNSKIITTEKDFGRLESFFTSNELFYIPIKLKFIGDGKENQCRSKNDWHHPTGIQLEG